MVTFFMHEITSSFASKHLSEPLHLLLSRILLLIRNRNLLLSPFQNPPQNQIQSLSRISNPIYIFNRVPASSDNVNWDWGTRIYNNVIKLIRIIE